MKTFKSFALALLFCFFTSACFAQCPDGQCGTNRSIVRTVAKQVVKRVVHVEERKTIGCLKRRVAKFVVRRRIRNLRCR